MYVQLTKVTLFGAIKGSISESRAWSICDVQLTVSDSILTSHWSKGLGLTMWHSVSSKVIPKMTSQGSVCTETRQFAHHKNVFCFFDLFFFHYVVEILLIHSFETTTATGRHCHKNSPSLHCDCLLRQIWICIHGGDVH